LLIAFTHLGLQLVIVFESGLKTDFAYKESDIISFVASLASHLAHARRHSLTDAVLF